MEVVITISMPWRGAIVDVEAYMESARKRLVIKTETDDNGCWIWQSATNGVYGVFSMKSLGFKTIYAHRASWVLFHGDIPEGMHVCHHCDTPLCVNPAHLFLGTAKDNIKDMFSKGRENNVIGLDLMNDARRARTACRQGHEYTEDNTHWTPGGTRVCLICRRAASKRYDERTQRKKVRK